MPKCVKCNKFLPPNYVEVIENSVPDFQGEYPKECIFCKLNVSEVERETSQGSGKFVSYTKDQCIKDYEKFIKKLKDSRSVKDILNKSKEIV